MINLTGYDKERIKKLRDAAVEPYINYYPFHLNYFIKHMSLDPSLSLEERYGKAYKYAFSKIKPSISDGELIVGKCDVAFSEEEDKLWESKYKAIAEEALNNAGGGQDSHMAIDYELVLEKGLIGIKETICEKLKTADDNKRLFYNSCLDCLDAVIIHSDMYADEAQRLAKECDDEERKAELMKIAEICRNVPANPARSFHEAVQSVHFITHCLTRHPLRMFALQYQLGHPDRYLLSYYENDIEKGIITKEYAQMLLDCLAIQINNRVPNGLSSGYMVGGRYSDGSVVANELTEMCMQSVDNVRLVYPAVGLCYNSDMPESLLTKACEILSHGCSHPAIFNDDLISRGLMEYGLSEEESHSYIHSTCVEITPVASSNVWVASPYTNMPAILLSLMDKEYDSYDDLLTEYFGALSASIKKNFEDQNSMRAHRRDNSINPLLSCVVNDCIERGEDIERGGARYNWIMPSFVGVGNLVDSLYAIKDIVFDKKELTMAEFKKALDANYEGYEQLHSYIANKLPKYGNDNDEIDKYYSVITEFIVNECKKHTPILRNALLIPSVFCWIQHEYFGRQTGATPDGRRAGFPLGDGSGPCQGRESNGPTASILSSTKWSHKEMIGGVAVNMKFSKKNFGKDSIENVVSLIKTYLLRGGFEMQINVVDSETLKKAQANPDDYRDLVVRIGGYSDYFTRLTEHMQAEVILRTEHEI